MQNIILGSAIALLKGAANVIGVTLAEMFGLLVTKQMVVNAIFYYLEKYANSTKTTLDDSEVAAWKKRVYESVLGIK
jgi:hypothetical protein